MPPLFRSPKPIVHVSTSPMTWLLQHMRGYTLHYTSRMNKPWAYVTSYDYIICFILQYVDRAQWVRQATGTSFTHSGRYSIV